MSATIQAANNGVQEDHVSDVECLEDKVERLEAELQDTKQRFASYAEMVVYRDERDKPLSDLGDYLIGWDDTTVRNIWENGHVRIDTGGCHRKLYRVIVMFPDGTYRIEKDLLLKPEADECEQRYNRDVREGRRSLPFAEAIDYKEAYKRLKAYEELEVVA